MMRADGGARVPAENKKQLCMVQSCPLIGNL